MYKKILYVMIYDRIMVVSCLSEVWIEFEDCWESNEENISGKDDRLLYGRG